MRRPSAGSGITNTLPADKAGSGPGLVGLARALSKLGICSRTQAWALIDDGVVEVNGQICRDPDYAIHPESAQIRIQGKTIGAQKRVYLALNKPRGLVTTRQDEKGRATVYDCFSDTELPFLTPVGRLDQASEGLLLFTNDSKWSAIITDPATHMDKLYHIQIGLLPDAEFLARLMSGIHVDNELLQVKAVRELRRGGRNAWIEVTLDEGKNRHLRRLLKAAGAEVLRLIRIAIGPLTLGDLAKGKWRHLTATEVRLLSRPGTATD